MTDPRGSEAAVVRAAWVPVRAEPSHRAEMVSQWVCGEVLEPLESRGEWLLVVGPDGYRGWCDPGGLLGLRRREAAAWAAAADRFSLGVALDAPAAEPQVADSVPRLLPWGARVAPAEGGRVRLPDGWEVLPSDPARLADPASRAERFPPEGSAVVRTAASWSGAPYLWGGRIREGTDCSGFVQAVYAAHGVPLPRDSGQQLRAGPPVDAAASRPDASRAGDLLFFGTSQEAVTHVAFSLGGGRILHAAAANGAVAADDLEELPETLRSLPERLVGATRPLAGAGD
jgi:hypothetical protein